MVKIYFDPVKGHGLMAVKKIKKGDFVVWYEGKLIKPTKIAKIDKIKSINSVYDFESEHGIILVDRPYHFSHYINDALNPDGLIKSIQSYNVKFKIRKRFDSIRYFNSYWPCFIAVRDIEPGEPIETFYGPGYWLNSLDANIYNENLLDTFDKYTLGF